MPQQAQQKQKIAKVVAAGPAVQNVKVGDRVLYRDSYDKETFPGTNDEYVLIKEEHILGRVK